MFDSSRVPTSSLIASFYFSSDNALNNVLGMLIVFRLTRKLLCDGENFLNNLNFARGYNGCLVHSLVHGNKKVMIMCYWNCIFLVFRIRCWILNLHKIRIQIFSCWIYLYKSHNHKVHYFLSRVWCEWMKELTQTVVVWQIQTREFK